MVKKDTKKKYEQCSKGGCKKKGLDRGEDSPKMCDVHYIEYLEMNLNKIDEKYRELLAKTEEHPLVKFVMNIVNRLTDLEEKVQEIEEEIEDITSRLDSAYVEL